MRRTALWTALVGLLLLPGGGARADDSSLPAVQSGARPGPGVLYAPEATAPQLENAGGWAAEPLMVSGAEAYSGNQYLYQDYIYDSHGANTTDLLLARPDSVPASTDTLFGGATGDVVYPTDAATYGFNAADLLEFRAKPAGSDVVVYRITLNTMLDPDAAAVAIGIDTDVNSSTGTNEWGHGIGSLGTLGLEHVVVSWGTGATFDGGPAESTADVTRNQIQIVVSTGEPNVSAATWRHYLVVGLWDGTGAFKSILEQPTATDPGGAHGTTPPPIFNVGFRFDEPMAPDQADLTDRGQRAVGIGHWREHAQAKALAARDISAFHTDIDFGALTQGVGRSTVPSAGYLNRLYVSHLDLGEGVQPDRPMLLGKIQPYSIFVPSAASGGRRPLHVHLHSLSCNYNQYAVLMPNFLEQIGEDLGVFVLTTQGRGPDGWFHDEAEYDLFEAWADVARNYALDPDRTTVGGYSMGGYGTFKMASQYPDLFAAGFAIVGPGDENLAGAPTGGTIEDDQNTMRIVDGLYNVPLLMWNGLIDELVPVAGVAQFAQRLHDLGYRHEFHLFPTHDHFLFGVVDEWRAASGYVGSALDRDPARVVYRAMPEMDNATLGLVHDHAYWVSGINVATGSRSGLVSARSHGLAEGAPVATSYAGVGIDPTPNLFRGIGWRPTVAPQRNALELDLTGVDAVLISIDRAGLSLSEPLRVFGSSTIAAGVTLQDGIGTVSFTAGPGPFDVTV